MPFDPRYYVTFTSETGLSVKVLVDSNSPSLSGGFGGWEIVDRPKRVAITRFKGKEPFKQDVPILFDGVSDGISQEDDINTLMLMDEQPGTGLQPPTVRVEGLVLRQDLTWVIDDITWDPQNVHWDVIGGTRVRLRQAAVVHLLQFIDDDILITAPTPAVKNGGGTVTKTRTVMHPGETVKQIAQDVYGDPTKYILILYANPLLSPDPRTLIPSGTILSVPGQTSFIVP